MKGLCLSNKLIIFLDVKVERANSQVKELDLRLHYWNFFFEARESSLSRVLQLVSDCQLDFERYRTSDNISAKKIPLPN